MKITAAELFKLGLWERFCKETGMSEWAVNEGQLPIDEVLTWELKAISKEGGNE